MNVKVGDLVMVHHKGLWGSNWLVRVVKVTPTGRFITEDGVRYGPNGVSRNNGMRVSVPTEKDLENIERQKLIQRLGLCWVRRDGIKAEVTSTEIKAVLDAFEKILKVVP